ncbi:MAG: hypothetical protein ACRDV8_11535, partial [Acidimicrobiales bacterium]
YLEHRIQRFLSTRRPRAVGPPAGIVVGSGMVLWGIERVVDEKLWLAYPGQLGDVLVEAAGLALAIAGVVVLVVARRRWRVWLEAEEARTTGAPVVAARVRSVRRLLG